MGNVQDSPKYLTDMVSGGVGLIDPKYHTQLGSTTYRKVIFVFVLVYHTQLGYI